MPAAAAASAKVPPQHAPGERRVAAAVGEQPAAIALGQPHAAEVVENGQRHQPLLAGFADDAHYPAGALDGGDLLRAGFAEPRCLATSSTDKPGRELIKPAYPVNAHTH
jgi:hypothetical protein